MAYAGGGTLAGSGNNALAVVGIEETTYGTATAAQMWAGQVNEIIFTKEDKIHENRGISNVRTLNSQTNIATRYGFRLAGEVDCGVPLAMALGNISATTDPTLTVLKGSEHATPTKTYLASWTIIREYNEATDDAVSLLGATVDTADFNIDLDGPFTYSLEGVAKSQATTNASAQTSPATAFGSWNTTIKIKEGAAAYNSSGAVTIDGLNSFGFSVRNNLSTRNEFGASAPVAIRQPVPGRCDLELRLVRGFIDDDFWDDICDGTVQSFQAVVNDGTNSLTMEFDSCFSKSCTHSANLEDQSDETATFSVKTMDCDVVDSITYVAWD